MTSTCLVSYWWWHPAKPWQTFAGCQVGNPGQELQGVRLVNAGNQGHGRVMAGSWHGHGVTSYKMRGFQTLNLWRPIKQRIKKTPPRERERNFRPTKRCPLFRLFSFSQDESLIATAVSSAQNCVSLGLGHGARARYGKKRKVWPVDFQNHGFQY